MASLADTDSLSGIEPLDSAATSPLLNAAPITTHPDRLSPASQLSSLRASMVQSSTLLKGSVNQDSPEFRHSDVSTLTQSSLERHNASHRSLDGISQSQPRFHHPSHGANADAHVRALSSLPATPYSTTQLDLQPQRLLATADSKHPSRSQTLQASSGSRLHHPVQSHQTTPAINANRQLFISGSRQSAGKEKASTHEPSRPTSHQRDSRPTLNTSSGEPAEIHRHQQSASSEIQEMERVRRSLYHMVHSAAGRADRDSLESKESVGELLASHHSRTENGLPRESFESAKTDSLLGPNAYQDVSPLPMDSGLGLYSSLLPLSGSIHVPNPSVSRNNSLFAENHMLTESLEKERLRRKHCEKLISEGQSELLETQQQLAVAIANNRKKDIMIEQLDKSLARIVDGWRKQEHEKTEVLECMRKENQELVEEINKMKEVVEGHQTELKEAEDQHSSELQQALQMQQEAASQLVAFQEDLSTVKAQLASEQKLTGQAQQQRDTAVDEGHRLERQVKQIQHMLAEERQQSQNVRKEFQDRIQQFEKERQQLLDKQKASSEEQSKRSDLLEAKQQEVEQLKADLDNAVRDKENANVELNLQQAQAEAARQKQEAQWQERLEKMVDDRLRELQLASSKAEAELRESHRRQLTELRDAHQSQMLSQRAAYSQDLAQRDKKIQDLTQQYQTRLEQNHQDMSQMTGRLEKAQRQRSLLVQQLQGVQVYCSDALSKMSHASPLIKELKSGIDAVKGEGGLAPPASPPSKQAERTQGSRRQESPITISLSPTHRGVGVGAGNLEDDRQEHEDGDGQEDEGFHFPDLSLATSKAAQSPPPSSSAFTLLSDSGYLREDISVNLSQYYRETAVPDTRGTGHAVKDQDETLMPSRVQDQDDYLSESSLSHGKHLAMQMLQHSSGSQGVALYAEPEKQKRSSSPHNVFPNRLETSLGTLQGMQGGPTQGLLYFSGSRSDSAPAKEAKPGKQHASSTSKPPSNNLSSFSQPPAPASASLGHRDLAQNVGQLSETRQDAAATFKGLQLAPAKEPKSQPSSYSEALPSQDLISEGLRLLKMSPPSGHSSPLVARQSGLSGLTGLTLGDILRLTGGDPHDGTVEGLRHHGRDDEFKDFRELQPSLNNTKTTNSVAAYPSEDETISDLESGPIHPNSSNILLEKLSEHKHRQMALQHYIQMLLQQPPGSPPQDTSNSVSQVFTKETASVAMPTGGLTTWHQQAPKGPTRAPQPTGRNPQANPRTGGLKSGHSQGQPQPTCLDQKTKVTTAGGTGSRQSTDKHTVASKSKGLTASTQSQAARSQRLSSQKAAPSARQPRQVPTSSVTSSKRVVRKSAVRN